MCLLASWHSSKYAQSQKQKCNLYSLFQKKKNVFLRLPGISVCADPDGGLVRPEELVFIDAAEATLLVGVPGEKEMNKKMMLKYFHGMEWMKGWTQMNHAAPSPVGCPGPALWGKREEAGVTVDAAAVFAFFTGGLY